MEFDTRCKFRDTNNEMEQCYSIFLSIYYSFIYFSFYNNYLEGEFVLYKHCTLSYAVHVFYRQCPTADGVGRASCNCAVAVKVDDDVIIIDKCGPKVTTERTFYPITINVFNNGPLTPGLQILSQYEGREYQVCKYESMHGSHSFGKNPSIFSIS